MGVGVGDILHSSRNLDDERLKPIVNQERDWLTPLAVRDPDSSIRNVPERSHGFFDTHYGRLGVPLLSKKEPRS